MFIPRGKPLHENLATSYVLVDALVADLCEGGFSGIVEITLSYGRAMAVIARGHLVAAVESSMDGRDKNIAGPLSYGKTTIAEIASAARRERGRVSIYSYSIEATEAIAGRFGAQALYTGLNTEFADLEKIISKLSRESDRQWFIETRLADGSIALVHIKDHGCRILTYCDDELREESGAADRNINAGLDRLLDEATGAGCTFDVYFKFAAETLESIDSAAAESEPPREAADDRQAEARDEISQAMREAKAIYSSIKIDAPTPDFDEDRTQAGVLSETGRSGLAETSDAERETVVAETARRAHSAELLYAAQQAGLSDENPTDVVNDAGEPSDDLTIAQEVIRDTGELAPAGDGLVMADIKRLMGDIARVVEEATKDVEQRDVFSIYLRAGQLKVADRYSFLDPFRSEFEYLGGEIAFIGEASPEEFVEGLTEAMRLAVETIARTSSQWGRLRSRVSDDLRWLYERHQQEFQRYGLDRTIAELINI